MNIKEFFNQHKKPILYWFILGMAILIAGGTIWWSWNNQKDIGIKTNMVQLKICQQDSDCVAVQDGCCGCNAGGKNTAINKKFKEEYDKKIQNECNDVGCIAVISNNPSCSGIPVCDENKCDLAVPLDDLKENQDISNWKTYRSEEYGFEMKYPNEYALEEKNINSSDQDYALLLFENTEEYRLIREGKLSGREGPTNINISIYPNLHDLTLLEWIKENRYSNFNLTDGTYLFKNLANNETIFYKWEGLYTGETLVLIKDKYVITLTVTYLNVGDKIKKDYDQILSIFRFIE